MIQLETALFSGTHLSQIEVATYTGGAKPTLVDDYSFGTDFVTGATTDATGAEHLSITYGQVQQIHDSIASDGSVQPQSPTNWDLVKNIADYAPTTTAKTTAGPPVVASSTTASSYYVRFVNGTSPITGDSGQQWFQVSDLSLGFANAATFSGSTVATGRTNFDPLTLTLGSDKSVTQLETALFNGTRLSQIEVASYTGGAQPTLVDDYSFGTDFVTGATTDATGAEHLSITYGQVQQTHDSVTSSGVAQQTKTNWNLLTNTADYSATTAAPTAGPPTGGGTTPADTPPAIGGTAAGQATNGAPTIDPFSAVTITDPDVGQTETATVTYAAANGTLTDPNAATDLSTSAPGTYTVAGSATAVQADLRGLVFTPTPNQATLGQPVTTAFTLAVSDGFVTVTDSKTSVVASAAETAPTITGLPAASQALNDNQTATPFAGAVLTDPDVGQTETVTLTLTSGGAPTDADGTLSLSGQAGFTLSKVQGSPGTYQLTGTSGSGITALQTALQAVVFTPTANQVPPGQTVTTAIGASISDGQQSAAASTSLVVTSINDPPAIGGTVAGQATGDKTPVDPFSAVTVTDPDVGQTETAKVTYTAANGTLADPNAATDLSTSAPGTYTVAGSATAVQTDLKNLVFTPTQNLVPVGQSTTTGFGLSVSDGIATTTNNTTSVAATSINDPPTLKQQTPLSFTVGQGQTLPGLWTALLANAQDVDPGDQAKLTISNVGSASTMGFVYLDPAHQVLTYTASGYNPAQPTDSFTYTVADPNGGTVTGTADVTVTGTAGVTAQVGTSGPNTLTASQPGQVLIGGGGGNTLNANASGAVVSAGPGGDTVNVTAAKATIYGGSGTNTINLGSNTSQDTIVLEPGGMDTITGFNLHNGDLLDLRQVFAASQQTATAATLGNYVKVADTGGNATLSFNGAALATLQGVGSGVTLTTLVNDGALKFS